MIRNLSPAAWGAPAVARLAFALTISDLSPDALQMDQIENLYSPRSVQPLNLSSGTTTIPVPDTTNQRGVVVWLPRNNVTTFVLTEHTGDTGAQTNSQGVKVLTFQAGAIPTNLYATVGAAGINEVTFYWF